MKRTVSDDRHGLAAFSLVTGIVGFYFWLYPEFGLFICAVAVAMGQYSKNAVFAAYGTIGGRIGLIGRNMGIIGAALNVALLYLYRW